MHLYVHIPFCHRVCPYCSFYKHTPGNTRLSEFVDALIIEAGFVADSINPPLKTVYFGGGTPSMLSPTLLSRLFVGLRDLFDFSQVEEITFEANPATFTKRTSVLYQNLGITRVSLGIQSFNEQQLQMLGREHSPEQATQSVHLLRDGGPSEVNIDLMFSVPRQTLENWEATLNQAILLKPDHISAYNLTYEEDTQYFEQLVSGEFLENDELNAEMFQLAHDILTSNGYEHYETSNYALPGFRSRHNEGYWLGNDYLGIGPSAVSTIDRQRWQNVSDTSSYMKQVVKVGHARESGELLDDEAWRLERIALQLRTKEGLPLKYLSSDTDLEKLSGLVETDSTHLRLTDRGTLLADSIATELA